MPRCPNASLFVFLTFLATQAGGKTTATTTTLASSVNPSLAAQPITLTATVTSSRGAPRGTVKFLDGTTSLGAATLSNGSASLTLSTLAVGTHSLKAVFSATSSYASSTSTTLPQVVNRAATATSVTSSANPATFGQVVTFTSAVKSSYGTPTGSVQLVDGSSVLANATLVEGIASVVVNSLAVGSHSITVLYSGDASHSPSASAPLVETINCIVTTTSLSSSLNPSIIGQAVTFTAVVSAASGTPTGSIQLLDGSTTIAAAALSGGRASWAVSELSSGTHPIMASYGGDSSHSASASTAISQVVQLHTVSLSWGASASPDIVGYNVYRSDVSGGPYLRVNSSPLPSLAYSDTTVTGGQTYYYVCTAVDSSAAESVYSNEVQAIVP